MVGKSLCGAGGHVRGGHHSKADRGGEKLTETRAPWLATSFGVLGREAH